MADKICARGFAAPAIFFLEAFKPLTALVHSGSLLSAPFVAMFLGSGFQHNLSQFLKNRENVEKLICLIEEKDRLLRNVRI